MYTKTYTIPVEPIRWKHPGRNGKQYYDLQIREKYAVGLYLQRDHQDSPMFMGPLKLELIFYMKIPKLVRNRSKSQWHANAPDCTNLVKFIEDAITKTGVIWQDDRQVAWQDNRKIYDTNPRIEIRITELE